MILKRKIYHKLVDWKNQSQGQTALLIEGASRIGKSTIVEQFAREQYRSYILINFSESVSKFVRDSFADLRRLDEFFQNLSADTGVTLYPRESLIIFDEVQRFPRAREAIKFLVADGRYDYIETGSLISIKENVADIVIPSEEKSVQMYPLDFEEFLWAAGEEPLLSLIKAKVEAREPLANELHNRAMRLFSEYLIVGGMPQSVAAFFDNHRDFSKKKKKKRDVLKLYSNDVRKAEVKYRDKVAYIFSHIPDFLSTGAKNVSISQDAPAQGWGTYRQDFFWLGDSMMANLCYRCSDPNVGFALNVDEKRLKCYLGDTGLLFSMAFSESEIKKLSLYRDFLSGRLAINKGMFFENAVAQMLVAQGRRLFFYDEQDRISHRPTMEIDFLLSNESRLHYRIFPLEVKSSKNYTTSSLDGFASKFPKRIGMRLLAHPKQFALEDGLVKLPPYMLPFFDFE